MIGTPVQRAEIIRPELRDRFPSAQNGKSIGMVRPQRLRVHIKYQIVGCILDRIDLF